MSLQSVQDQSRLTLPAHSTTGTFGLDEFDDDEKNYPVVTEDEMGETFKHYETISSLYILLQTFFAARSDVSVLANMSLYYEKGKPSRWYAPDLMVCFGVENKPRRVYRTWKENVFPQVVFEAASEATVESDLGKKYLEYDRLGAEEYYLLDPERTYLPHPLMAFQRANGGRLLAVKIADDRVFSPRLGLEIVDTGKMFRLFDNTRQKFLLTLQEAEAGLQIFESKFEQAENERLQVENENAKLQAEIARLRELLNQKR